MPCGGVGAGRALAAALLRLRRVLRARCLRLRVACRMRARALGRAPGGGAYRTKLLTFERASCGASVPIGSRSLDGGVRRVMRGACVRRVRGAAARACSGERGVCARSRGACMGSERAGRSCPAAWPGAMPCVRAPHAALRPPALPSARPRALKPHEVAGLLARRRVGDVLGGDARDVREHHRQVEAARDVRRDERAWCVPQRA